MYTILELADSAIDGLFFIRVTILFPFRSVPSSYSHVSTIPASLAGSRHRYHQYCAHNVIAPAEHSEPYREMSQNLTRSLRLDDRWQCVSEV